MCFDDSYFSFPFVSSLASYVPGQGTTVNPADTLLMQPCPGEVQSGEVSQNVTAGQGVEVHPAVGSMPPETLRYHPPVQLSQSMSHPLSPFFDANHGLTRQFTGVMRSVRRRFRGVRVGDTTRTTCQWQSQDSSVCDQEITGETVPKHLAFHGIQNMSRGHVVRCCWRGCGVLIKRQSLTRHFREAHLGLKRKSCAPAPSTTLVPFERTEGGDETFF